MPPATSYRRTTNALPPLDNDPFTTAPRRTAAGRAIRPNTTRPTNYYARSYGSFASAAAANGGVHAQETEPGFFPAIQFFSDAITALPKEVMRQFTLMKEVEAKIHGPNQRMGEIIDALLELPVPARSASHGGSELRALGLPSLTANNSTIGSANVSMVNGVEPSARDLGSAQNSVAGSIDDENGVLSENRSDIGRRKQYYELRLTGQSLLPNLDEKNAVLSEANRVMGLQLMRIDSVLPHIDNETSEDARLGSMTHWAYSDNRQKKQPSGSGAHSRAVQATNALASVASAFHEAEITQARREAGREATREKQKSRAREHVDSDFDDRPRKTQKLGKLKPGTPTVTGLGITANGDTGKRKKVEKLGAPAMERSASNNKANKVGRESPRSTPLVDVTKKPKGKPGPLPKKKLPNSASNSPALVSSPLHHSFNPTNMVEPPTSVIRPQSSRLRQNSSSNLRHEKFAEESTSRPASATGKLNGNTKPAVKKRPEDVPEDKMEGIEEKIHKTTETESGTRFEDLEHTEPDRDANSRSRSQSGRAGPNSKNGTPRLESGADVQNLSRTRSTRSTRGNGGHESSSSEPQQQGPVSSHKRAHSNSHLVRQLAPYNRSPDHDRHYPPNEDDDDTRSIYVQEIFEGPVQNLQETVVEERRVERKPISRRNTGVLIAPSPGPSENAADDEDETMAELEIKGPEPDLLPDTGEPEFDEDDSEHDPDDPNEPRYCYCNRGSYGEMVACDNENCAKEWFHLGCTELTDTPGEEEVWYCRDCRPKFEKKRGGRGTVRGRAV